MSIVVFGAGAIGRGLLGELAARAGWPITFVEAQRALARQLAAAGRYRVRLVGREVSTTCVTGYQVLSPTDGRQLAAAIAGCRLAATAVGGANLAAVAGSLSAAVAGRREPLPVLVCENWPRADLVLAEALRLGGTPEAAVRCIACSVERMVQREGADLDLVGESRESAWVQADVGLPGLQVCSDLGPYYARKLYTNNAGHALLAYEGFLAGHETLCAALAEPVIRARLEALLAGAATMLASEYNWDRRDLTEHLECLLRYRFANEHLADRVDRVARQPLRKLGPQERLIGLLRRLEAHRLPLQPVCRTVAAALCYDDPRDADSRQLQALVRREGAGGVLTKVCQLTPGEEGYRLCLAEWTALWRTRENS